MKTPFVLLVSFLFVGISGVQAATYEIDGSHTSVEFRIRHMGLSSVRGSFVDFKGSFEFDPENIASSSASAVIQISSINTGNKKRDEHLLSDDFFNQEKFPEMTFKTTAIKNVKKDTFTAVGDLTIHGITRTVELDVEYNGSVKDPWGNYRAGFSATAELNRKDFGLKWSKLLETGALVVGKMVKVTIEVEGVRKE